MANDPVPFILLTPAEVDGMIRLLGEIPAKFGTWEMIQILHRKPQQMLTPSPSPSPSPAPDAPGMVKGEERVVNEEQAPAPAPDPSPTPAKKRPGRKKAATEKAASAAQPGESLEGLGNL